MADDWIRNLSDAEYRAYNKGYHKGRVEELGLAASWLEGPFWFFRLYSLSRKSIARDLRARADLIQTYEIDKI